MQKNVVNVQRIVVNFLVENHGNKNRNLTFVAAILSTKVVAS
jgi:hypothetical protein